MQPPPRKVKESQQVKLVFTEQLSKLQNKQHQDNELLEEIRSFSKQRAAIEREYGQALQRLAVQYQKRDWQRGNADTVMSGGVCGVWRSVVDATAQASSWRLAASEDYRELIGQTSRGQRNTKDARAKRGLEQLQCVQTELLDALRELQRMKKNYRQLSSIAATTREKAADAHIRAKRSEHGLFHSRSGLHKMTAKLSARLKECDDRLTEVRNEYLLTLAAVNAQSRHYYSSTLPHIMEVLDGDVYEWVQALLSMLCGNEIDVCVATHRCYSSVWDAIAKVTRERNVHQFLQESPSLSCTIDFNFQPEPHDKGGSEVSVSEGEGSLVREAKKWASKAAKDYKIIAHGERALQTLQSRLKLLTGEMSISVEQKIVDVKESVRKAQVSRLKAEARLSLLSQCIVGVECWLAEALSRAEEELERERRLSEQRKSTAEFSGDKFELTDFEDYADENGDIFEDPVITGGMCVYPAACRAVYSYQASQSDELSVTEGEELQVVEDGDMEDWLKVCNICGHVGYVPECHVLLLPAEDAAQLDVSLSPVSSLPRRVRGASQGVARALYSYQAQSAEELSFQEGALIRLTRSSHGEVDDGFWEGELGGRIGVFPSLVVELVQDEGAGLSAQSVCPQAPAAPPLRSSPPHPHSQEGSSEEHTDTVLPADVGGARLRPCREAPPPPVKRTPQASD